MGVIVWSQDIGSPKVGNTVEVTATFGGAQALSGLVITDFTAEDAGGNVITPTNYNLLGRVATFRVTTMVVGNLVISIDADAGGAGNPPSDDTYTVTFAVIVVTSVGGRAAANPAAKNYGTNILGIVAEQLDYSTPIQLASDTPDPATVSGLYPNVIEFRPPYSLTPVKQFYPVQRLKGNPSPDPSIPGMQMGAGELHFYLDPTLAPFWIKHLLQTATEISASFGTGVVSGPGITTLVAASGANTYGAVSSVDADKQPSAILQDGMTFTSPTPPIGMTAARVEFTVDGAGTILVKGVDQNGTPLEDELVAVGSALTVKTLNYYADKITIQVKASADLNVSAFTYDLSEVYEHKLAFVSEVSEGLTLEVQEGNKDSPIIYPGLLVTRGILRLEDVCRMQMQVISNKAFPRQAMHGGDVGTTLTNFGRLDFHAVPNLGMLWEIGGGNVPSDMQGSYRVSQVAMAIDNRMAPPATSYGDDFFYPKPVRKMNRELQTQVVIDYSKEANFDQFVGGLNFESTLSAISRPYGGPYRVIRVKMNNSQIVANPTRQVGGLEELLQMIAVRANIGASATGNDEANITIINTEATF